MLISTVVLVWWSWVPEKLLLGELLCIVYQTTTTRRINIPTFYNLIDDEFLKLILIENINNISLYIHTDVDLNCVFLAEILLSWKLLYSGDLLDKDLAHLKPQNIITVIVIPYLFLMPFSTLDYISVHNFYSLFLCRNDAQILITALYETILLVISTALD